MQAARDDRALCLEGVREAQPVELLQQRIQVHNRLPHLCARGVAGAVADLLGPIGLEQEGAAGRRPASGSLRRFARNAGGTGYQRTCRSSTNSDSGCAIACQSGSGSSPSAQAAARLADGILNRWFIDAALLGRYPADVLGLYRRHDLLPDWDTDELLAFQEDSLDFIGVDYYYPHYTSADAPETAFALNTGGESADKGAFSIAGLFRFVRNPRGRFTDRDWEIDPEGLYDLLMRAERYRPGIPIYVTEYGIVLVESPNAAGQIQDQAGIDFVRDHLKLVHRASADGADVRGYYMWSLMDNFSWINGFKKRHGFLYVYRETLERRRKLSSNWYQQVAADNGFED